MNSVAYAALWIFVFSVPWESIIRIGGTAAISRVTGILALGVALLTAAVSGRVRRWHGFHVAALLFVMWAGCTIVITRMPIIPRKFWTFVQLFLALWMIWELAPSRQRLLGLLTAYVVGAYVAAIDTILLYRREAAVLRRFAAGEADPNDLAMTLALGLPMAWYLATTHRDGLMRWVCRGYLLVGIVAIGLTGSRGGLVATMVALLIVPLTMTRLSPSRLAAAVAILSLAGALAVAYVPDTIVARLATTTTEVEDVRFGGRYKIWVAGLHAFAHKPVMGYGTSGFISAITPELGRMSLVAHNSYLSVLVEEGLVGLLLFLAMFGTVFLAVLDLPTLERRFALVLLATLGIAMLPLTWEDRKSAWFILAALLGLARAHLARTGGAVRPQLAPRAGSFARPPRKARPLTPLAAPGPDTHRGRETTA
jgi:O-antigen ligase